MQRETKTRLSLTPWWSKLKSASKSPQTTLWERLTLRFLRPQLRQAPLRMLHQVKLLLIASWCLT